MSTLRKTKGNQTKTEPAFQFTTREAYLVGLLILGQMADAVTTHFAVSKPGVSESNPIMRKVLSTAGPTGLYALKIALVAYAIHQTATYYEPGSIQRERHLAPIIALGILPAANNATILWAGSPNK